MDVFKFRNPTNPMIMQQGEIINGLTSKMWIERYAESGEFTFTAPMSSDIRTILPIGTFISHVNTTDIMIVEDHGISESKDADGEITVTGRGLETILEQRIIGSNKTFPISTGVADYEMSSDELSHNIRDLILNHIAAYLLIDDNNAIPYINIVTSVTGETPSALSLQQKDVYSTVLQLLQDGDLGIKAIRPGPWYTPPTPGNSVFEIHKGADLRKTVSFSHDSGELERADYFWSNRKDKNCALIQGRWVQTTVVGTQVESKRRWMVVDASDIDQARTEAPTGSTLTAIVNKMQRRGASALKAQKNIALSKAEVSKQAVRAQYRVDYELGDLVSVEGNYNEDSIRRVSEYVEIEDKNGRSGYPTLSEP